MLLTIEISDDYVASLNMHLATQNRIDTDPVTNGQTVTPIYSGIEDFIGQTVGQVVQAIAERFPTGAFRDKLLARKALMDSMATMTRPTVTITQQTTPATPATPAP